VGILVMVGLFLFLGLLVPESACAWGAGIHIEQGIRIINNVSTFNPTLAPLIQSFSSDFLYGCIAPDIFIGKGSKQKNNHCHNWSVGRRLLENAETERNIVFAYGYLSHLASDIIPHNFFIPNQLFNSSMPKKIGHVYWEYRCDEYTEPEYLKLAEYIIQMLQQENDETMLESMNRRKTPFQSKKELYIRFIRMQNKNFWSKTLNLISKRSKKNVAREYFLYLNKLSYKLIRDFLINEQKSLAIEFDPIGSKNLVGAKKMRRRHIFSNYVFGVPAFARDAFSIPETILNL